MFWAKMFSLTTAHKLKCKRRLGFKVGTCSAYDKQESKVAPLLMQTSYFMKIQLNKLLSNRTSILCATSILAVQPIQIRIPQIIKFRMERRMAHIV